MNDPPAHDHHQEGGRVVLLGGGEGEGERKGGGLGAWVSRQ